MKATLKNPILISAFIIACVASPAYADLEAVTVVATHLNVETDQLKTSHQSDSNKVTSEYTDEVANDLDERLTRQFENSLIEQPQTTAMESSLLERGANESRLEAVVK